MIALSKQRIFLHVIAKSKIHNLELNLIFSLK